MYLDHYTNDIPEAAMQAAEKGLAWLKESGPIYGLDVNKVNIGKLDLSSHCQCVLGQLGNDYDDVVRSLEEQGVVPRGQTSLRVFDSNESWVQTHGFQCSPQETPISFRDLDAAWTVLLTADRAEQNQAT